MAPLKYYMGGSSNTTMLEWAPWSINHKAWVDSRDH